MDRVTAKVAEEISVFFEDNNVNAGNLAAVMSWNAMAAIFPLLLVLTTVLGLALHGNPHLQKTILNSALGEFPVIGTQVGQQMASALAGNSTVELALTTAQSAVTRTMRRAGYPK